MWVRVDQACSCVGPLKPEIDWFFPGPQEEEGIVERSRLRSWVRKAEEAQLTTKQIIPESPEEEQ